MSQQVLTVSQTNEYIRTIMDRDPLLTGIAVKGEISNYKAYPSGHHYFTLKDESSALKCVMFRTQAMRIRFKPENGMKIIAMGKIGVYPRDGAYQLYCTGMVVDGVGDLYAAYEQLKAKLFAQGLFSPEHKKQLPVYPKVIGIVTSSAGAAVHDMIRILRKRYPLVKVRLIPVRVQGAEAAGEIAAAIRYANHYRLADLLIVGRGGGSIEDLWSFNEEIVARAIYDSDIPVISAVGHEPDVTISDFVADMRASTPSNAAEIAVPDQDALRQNLDTFSSAMETALLRQIQVSKKQLKALASSSAMQSPERYYLLRRQALENLSNRLCAAQQHSVSIRKQRYVSLAAKLDALSPLKVLTRGYAIVQNADGELVRSVQSTHPDDIVDVTVGDGTLRTRIMEIKEHSL